MMRRMDLVLAAVFSLAAVGVTGCRKQPAIDLSGVRAYPGAGVRNVAAREAEEFPNEPFPPMELNGDEGWQSTGRPVGESAGDKDGAGRGAPGGLLQDGTRWNEVVYFDFDSSEVNAAERPKLDALATLLKENAAFGLVVEGHCDERGSDEYNRALSERRALAVVEYLASLGIEAARMQTVSYGEDRPVVREARTEADHQKNRRAEFLYGARG